MYVSESEPEQKPSKQEESEQPPPKQEVSFDHPVITHVDRLTVDERLLKCVNLILVREKGLEPSRREAHAPKACVSTNSTTRA